MIKGSATNLKFYKLSAKLQQGNALELQKSFKKSSIEAIATDPPYGRSAKVGAKSLKSLYKGFFESAHYILKPKHYIPSHGDIKKLASAVELGREMDYVLGKTVHLLQNGYRLVIE